MRGSHYHPVRLQDDIRHVLKLKGLLGSKVKSLRIGEHPLALLFASEQKYLAGDRLAQPEYLALGSMSLLVKTFFEMESSWQSRSTQMVEDLLSAKRCEAFMFELYVIRYGIWGKVGRIHWSPWAPGKDIQTSDPRTDIECKLILKKDLEGVFKRVRRARRQPHSTDAPFVVAVGFTDEFEENEAATLGDWCKEHGPDFARNMDVAATLIFLPTAAGGRSQVLGMPTLLLHKGTYVEVINHSALNPLPAGFSFGERPQSMIGGHTSG